MRNKVSKDDRQRQNQRRRVRNLVVVALAAGAGFCFYSVLFFFYMQPEELAPVKQGGMHVLHVLAKEIPPLKVRPTPSITVSSTPAAPPPVKVVPGYVLITLAGRGQLWIDGERLNKTMHSQTIELEPVPHVVMLQRGTRLQSQKVTVNRGAQVHVDFTVPPDMRRRAAPAGEESPQADDGESEE